ncbi:MAG: MFS transporter, partial [Deltaproteobacteria bacterium]|nr:MFS transporter [Deltaproteobacteria bacterium]
MKPKLVRIAWYLYDFGNSSYSAVIASTIFPVYFATQIVGSEKNLGDALWGKAISISMIMCAALSPYVGGIADVLGVRKKMLLFFTSMCVLCVGCFSFLKRGMIVEGFLLAVFANFAMETAVVFYNSILISLEEKYGLGRISSLGFATGYLGSVISLLISLFLLERGLTNLIWPFCGAFFFLFSIPLIVTLPPERS